MSEAFFKSLKQWKCEIQPRAGLRVSGEPQTFIDPAEIKGSADSWWEKLMVFKPSGWAQFSDANVLIRDGEIIGKRPEELLLATELYTVNAGNGGILSHHLRLSESGWIGTTLEKTFDPLAQLETRTFIGSAPCKSLTYEVAWSGTPLRPTLCRLTALTAQS